VEGQKDQIIYTKNLVPTLAKYFKKINGIIAENGSLLSHLAIVARENRIPVMINVDIHKLKLKIGDKVNMDGKKVEIKKVG
jgi:pyruvate,water dikinase